jgi:hypothetical protein
MPGTQGALEERSTKLRERHRLTLSAAPRVGSTAPLPPNELANRPCRLLVLNEIPGIVV